jgi:hypothetical protein
MRETLSEDMLNAIGDGISDLASSDDDQNGDDEDDDGKMQCWATE